MHYKGIYRTIWISYKDFYNINFHIISYYATNINKSTHILWVWIIYYIGYHGWSIIAYNLESICRRFCRISRSINSPYVIIVGSSYAIGSVVIIYFTWYMVHCYIHCATIWIFYYNLYSSNFNIICNNT